MSSLKRLKNWIQRPWPEVDGNTFILWEPCSKSHGEVVPGYVRYLQNLGYEVLVLMTPARLKEGLFSRFDEDGVRHGRLSQRQIRRFVKTPAMQKAAGLLVTTVGKLPETTAGAGELETVFGKQGPKQMFFVDHDVRKSVDRGIWDKRFITLRKLDYKNAESTVVNPHFFGTVDVTPKSSGKTVLLAVGAARSKRGNLPLVFQSAMDAVRQGHSEFEIRLIGKPGTDPVPEPIRPNVSILGQVPFDRLYREIENADFLLTSFQENNEDHEFYKTGGTSGAFQLSYGFSTPMIVQETFGQLNDLNDRNAIMYRGDEEMTDAILRAINLDKQSYAVMQKKLQATAARLYEMSLKNLKVMING